MSTIIKMNRKEAMALQIESAIKLYYSDDYIPSLTLAGAAETGVPKTDEPHLISKVEELGEKRGKEKRVVITEVNITKDWLKHPENKRDSIDFDPIETIFMIIRAITKYNAYYSVLEFEDFINYIRNHPEYSKRLGVAS